MTVLDGFLILAILRHSVLTLPRPSRLPSKNAEPGAKKVPAVLVEASIRGEDHLPSMIFQYRLGDELLAQFD